MHETMLNQCCYVLWRRNIFIMCGVGRVFFKVCLSTLLHPNDLYFCAIIYSSHKTMWYFFLVLINYQSGIVYTCICTLIAWFAVLCSAEFAFIFEVFCSTEWYITCRFIDLKNCYCFGKFMFSSYIVCVINVAIRKKIFCFTEWYV